ncbi:hypothetical protein BWQ96_03962 [Gracilariopsis chorda]|uniref:Uncharacterized protein n=1 Tax=Gracilariopsis chorda TaxID=448386 RepID=A0A2V3IVY1_9FLOR|nr:hypothetical protein BWQ96_03962 [Gracilariopsis chorda]|eukprot:PXF46306.1 hypothetical protein BWQ96_03962 [Gracilariopsis chorda]
MNSAGPQESTEARPDTYESACKLLYNTRRWGPRLLQRTCVRFKVSPQRLLRAFCIISSIRRSRIKSHRHQTRPKKARIDPETLKLARETLLAASSSTYVDQQHVHSLVNGTQVQMCLRDSSRYVDVDSEHDPFLSAVRSLPHSAYVSLSAQKRIAKQLGVFYRSIHSRSTRVDQEPCRPVARLTKHIARYRTHACLWRQQISLRGPLALYNELKSSAEVANLDKDVVDVGIRAIASAFETEEAIMRYGRGLEVFTDLLNGEESSLWNALVSAKSRLDAMHKIELESLPPLEHVERIRVKLGGLEAIRANPQVLLSSKFVSSDDFVLISLSFCKDTRRFEELVAIFDAFCSGTSASDCRRATELVWKEGGLQWINGAKMKVICDKLDLTVAEAGRLRWFANNFLLGGKQITIERVKQAVSKITMHSEIVEQADHEASWLCSEIG